MKKKVNRIVRIAYIIFIFFGISIIPNISGFTEKDKNILVDNIQNNKLPLFNDPPAEDWNITVDKNNMECGQEVQETIDGGFICVGNSFNDYHKTNEVILCKVDSFGNNEWNKTYKGEDADWSSGNSVKQCSDGGFIITGDTEDKDSNDCVLWLFKTDANGNMVWNKTFNLGCDGHGYSVLITSDGGFLIAGFILMDWEDWYDIWLIKTDVNGNEEWNQTLGGINDDMCFDVQQTSDGGFIITGSTAVNPFEDYDVLLIKTDNDGNEEWSKTFGGLDFDEGWGVDQTLDGGYIITGLTESYGSGSGDVWLIKTDANGEEEWSRTFGGTDYDWGLSGHQTTDNGFIITGLTESYGSGEGDLWLLKTNVNGNLDWSMTFGGGDFDIGSFVRETSDEGYIITGGTVSFGLDGQDLWLIKISGTNQPPNDPDIKGPNSLKINEEGTFTVTGTDPNEDQIYLYIDWGDGETVDWDGPFNSGQEVNYKHTWTTIDRFIIKVKAKDTFNEESGRTEFEIKISNPRTRTSYWLRFLDIYPILQRILNIIL
jgi:hypothetical protein